MIFLFLWRNYVCNWNDLISVTVVKNMFIQFARKRKIEIAYFLNYLRVQCTNHLVLNIQKKWHICLSSRQPLNQYQRFQYWPAGVYWEASEPGCATLFLCSSNAPLKSPVSNHADISTVFFCLYQVEFFLHPIQYYAKMLWHFKMSL